MGYRIFAEEEVWQSYADIPDDRDRSEALLIIRSLVDDPYPKEAESNVWTFGEDMWMGYSIDLSSGNGFIPYSAFVLSDGTEAVRLWPVVWCDIGL